MTASPRGLRTQAALWVAVLCLLPGQAVGQAVGGGVSAWEVEVSKPLMGENYDPMTGLVSVQGRLARGPGSGFILRGSFIRSTSGRATSSLLANPSVGAWARWGRIPLEMEVTLPLMQEWGDDDFATDVARLSDLTHRERYLPDRWAVSLATTPRIVFRDGSAGGMELGGVAVLPHDGRDLDLLARYQAWVSLRFATRVHGGARIGGTLRLNGQGGFDQRTQQDLALFLAFPSLKGYPEVSFRLPVDIDLQDFVTGVVALRVRF